MYRLLLVGRSIFRTSSRLQILIYIKMPRQTVRFCFDMETIDWMFFQLYIHRINIIFIRMFNQRSDCGKSITELILYSGSMFELDLAKPFTQILHILYVRYNFLVLHNPFILNMMNQNIWVSNNQQLLNIHVDGHFQTKNTSLVFSHVFCAIKLELSFHGIVLTRFWH